MARTVITNTALVNWLQRTGAIDLEPLREALAESLTRAVDAAGEIGAASFNVIADGLIYVIEDGALVKVASVKGRRLDHARRKAVGQG